jgi:hypothetical protein
VSKDRANYNNETCSILPIRLVLKNCCPSNVEITVAPRAVLVRKVLEGAGAGLLLFIKVMSEVDCIFHGSSILHVGTVVYMRLRKTPKR